MLTRTKAHDGTIMVVLNSGAKVSVLKDKQLIPSPSDVRMPLISFKGVQTWCEVTGKAAGGVMFRCGEQIAVTLGYSGVISNIKDNLGSVPVMRNISY